MLVDASPVLAPRCDGGGHSSRASGVYFYSPVRIYGGVFLDQTDGVDRERTFVHPNFGPVSVLLPGTRCQEGLHFIGDGDPGKDNTFTATGLTPTRTSEIYGPVEARGVSYIRLDDWNFYHNLVLEDDIDAEFGGTFVMTTPAYSRTNADTHGGVKIPANQCGYAGRREARGNKVILAGQLDQDIRFPADTTLTVDALEINKSFG